MEDYFGDMLKDETPSLEAVVQKGVRIPGKVRKFFAGYFSLGLLLGGLGVGMARGQEKDKPVNIGQASGKATTLVYNPNDKPGSSSTLMETPIAAPERNLDFILTSQFFPEPLVQVYQTMPLNLLNSTLPTYSTYFKQAAELSKGNDENRKQAVEFFGKAIEMDSKKSFQDSMKLDDVAKALYAKAYTTKAAAGIEEALKEKKSSWLVRNLPWLIPLAAAVGYGIYELAKPKSTTPTTPVEQDYKTNLNFAVYVADSRGQVKTYTLNDIMTSSNVTIAIPDLGVTNVDDERMGIFGPGGNLEFIANTSTGTASFIAQRSHKASYDFNYTILLLPHTTSKGEVINYDLLDAAALSNVILKFGPNITYRRGTDVVAGPEELMTEGPAQLNNALVVGDLKLGSIKKVDTGGNFMIYYYPKPSNALGDRFYEDGIYKVRINSGGPNATMLMTIISEIAELCGNFDDLNGGPSYGILTDFLTTGNLNEVGKALWRCRFVMYQGKLGATQEALAQSSQSLTANIGNASITANPQSKEFGAGYKGKNVSVAAHTNKQGTDFAAGAQFDRFGANMALSSTKDRTVVNASGNATLEGIALAMSGMYDSSGANRFGINMANKPKGNQPHLQAGYARQSNKAGVQQSFNAQAEFNSPVGIFIVSGDYSTAEGMAKAEQLALNVATQLKLDRFGVLYVGANYNRQQFGGIELNTTGISLQKPFSLGPVMFDLNLGWNSVYGATGKATVQIDLK